jgi:arginine-tRNA-protein transferase
MTAQTIIKMYATHPHECSYLHEEEATTLFIDPAAQVTPAIYHHLSQQGFRRSGGQLYKPYCERCCACIPVRILVQEFQPKRSQRKVMKKNNDLRVVERNDINTPEFYQLYERYINEKHRDGDMYPASEEQFETFLTSEWGVTRYFCFYQQKRLVAVAVTDRLEDSLSAIYTFYDPDLDPRSLGNYAILWQIDKARAENLDYLYLGYWIKSCRKMAYKSLYRPMELYLDERWMRLN